MRNKSSTFCVASFHDISIARKRHASGYWKCTLKTSLTVFLVDQHPFMWSLISDEGLSLRATFLIDPEGVVKAYEFHDSIGRSSEELIRKLEAAKFVAENNGQVCPVNWKPGGKTLKPAMNLVGKI